MSASGARDFGRNEVYLLKDLEYHSLELGELVTHMHGDGTILALHLGAHIELQYNSLKPSPRGAKRTISRCVVHRSVSSQSKHITVVTAVPTSVQSTGVEDDWMRREEGLKETRTHACVRVYVESKSMGV